ncbi:MAG: ABC transporter permease subunit [Bacteroidales bacterium]|nr:ABC transporter permease subunit [Bacteroidales bacterium]
MRRILPVLALLLTLFGCAPHKEVHSLDDLRDGRIGVLTGLAHRQDLQEAFPDATFMNFEDLPLMCMALQGQRIDALVCLEPGLEELLKGNPGFMELPGLSIRDSVCVAFRMEDADLADAFDDFLEEIRADGRMEQLQANWFGPGAPRSFYHPHIKTGTPLRVGIEVGQSGLTVMEDEEETGFEPELMRRFADHLERPVRFIEMTGTGMIPALASGRVDALVDAITPTYERGQSVRFSRPYYSCDLHLVVLNPDYVPEVKRQTLGEVLRTNLIDEGRYMLILKGLWYTLVIMFCSVLLGTLLGALLCWMLLGRSKALKKFAHGYCELIEGIPIVVLLLFMFYVVFAAAPVAAVVVAIVTYSLHFAAGACESFHNGIESVPRGQFEGGLALGFTQLDTLRYVMLPQATRQILLLFKGKSVALIENTAIVGFIAIQDLTKVTDIIRTQTYNSLIPLVVVGVLYFLLARLIGWTIDKLGDYLLKK